MNVNTTNRHDNSVCPYFLTVLIIDRANEFTVALARFIHDRGGVTVFEPGYLSRNADNVEALLQVVDLLKYSEELKFQGQPFKQHPLARSDNLKLVIETRGRAGVIARRKKTEIRLTTTPILKIVDTVGAGDAFMAGFLTGIAEKGLFELSDLPDSDL